MSSSSLPRKRIRQTEIAQLFDIGRAAVKNWIDRHETFPAPIRSDGTDYYQLAEVVAWADHRTIRSNARFPNESPGTTYGERARGRLDGEVRPQTAGVLTTDDEQAAQSLVAELTGQLGKRVGGTSQTAYLELLFCSILLKTRLPPSTWEELVRAARETSPSAIVQHIGRTTDGLLKNNGFVPGFANVLRSLHPDQKALTDVLDRVRELGRSGFQLLLDKYQDAVGLNSTNFFTPPSVTTLAAELLLEGATSHQKIYDPYARSGEMLIAAAAARPPTGVTLHGASPDSSTMRLAGLHLMLYRTTANLSSGHSSPWDDAETVLRKSDLILTNPPFNQPAPILSGTWPFGKPPKGNNNFAWLQHCYNLLDRDGRAAVVLPNIASISADPREQKIRGALADSGALEAIIALPPKQFQRTSIPVCIWLLRQGGNREAPVLFIDASTCGRNGRGQRIFDAEARGRVLATYRAWRADRAIDQPGAAFAKSVQRAEIKHMNSSLYPPNYVTTGNWQRATVERLDTELAKVVRHRNAVLGAIMTDVLSTTRPASGVLEQRLLGSLCRIQAGPSNSLLKATNQATIQEIPLVSPKHLTERRITGRDEIRLERSLDKFKLTEDDILCVRSGSIGQVALVTDQQRGWRFDTNLLRLHEFERDLVDPHYLLGYLSLPRVMEWLQRMSKASTAIPTINAPTLRQLTIDLPPISEQQRIGRSLRELDDHLTAARQFTEAAGKYRSVLAAHLMHAEIPANGVEV
ncbi:N-6 DNA methylase [Saccharopolyspora shandongensis]|uniref:N-6 DNA methylase n=1 Tax=Saccharopolyspora shandongensis TaxID=418495 RepID=UPI0033C3F51F